MLWSAAFRRDPLSRHDVPPRILERFGTSFDRSQYRSGAYVCPRTFRLQLEPTTLSLDMPSSDNAFLALGLDAELAQGLAALGFLEPTAIQTESIPALLAGRDVLGQAATGTGKTAAFALPLLHRLKAKPGKPGAVRALILVPTRELAMQVAQAVQSYGRKLGTRVLAVYGGQAMQLQLRALQHGVDVVVATPGRAMDHLRRGSLKLEHVEMVVLDEADEMLDMGFAEDIDTILRTVPTERQTALFSATLPRRIVNIANSHLREPLRVHVQRADAAEGVAPLVQEHVYVVGRRFKGAALARVLDMDDVKSVIVFCRTRTDVDSLTATMNARGKSAEAIHGGLSQEQRDRVLRRFRDGTLGMLIATDVAARGLDIDHVSHVVNFDLPTSPEVYVHRIGRTGRAGREGTAITLIDVREQRLIRTLEAHTKRKITVMMVPSVDEMRVKRLVALQASLAAACTEDGLERYRSVVDAMGDEYALRDVAAAALKMLDKARAGNGEIDTEIPNERIAAPVEFKKDGVRKEPLRRDGPRKEHPEIPDAIKLYITVGRRDGIRPGDLVGAIANLANIEGRSIGAITLSDRFTLVEVPEQKAQGIIDALRGAMIRGKKVSARRDRDAEHPNGSVVAPHVAPKRAGGMTHTIKRKREAVPA